ncbi:ATP-dependent RNA helicase dbp10 [Fulvia fulva]|uniref:RNA helicase n=1 Tax=Passalora fulva TaxID=5499 RepID=A0A9Q8PEE6_PASFU|nr:ATP-dependent RNA helicase dbp10 [Fulvia fulva]KAK4617890.1 ATP-dependent RNA helicase dbp10 [Fulvia fulva]KAK4618671.1 ATP-dependent RNA helicase dbp10 [Fulvia fulva]UJO20940.1 ATP-dependent RNA helicase dbp10 [Fulvia fulva]WPV18555.1 ATP-dependent RNA helicase dbp10 [Fulvia fulva]WPV33481.1 ATP-dependent RNA helicase dbp10 [Fulvia fulva]
MVRAASPALSENEFDISKSLFGGQDAGSDSDNDFSKEASQFGGKAAEDLALDSDDGADEAFIAATQAAANRKSENKNAKKAGAFQTMGLNTHLLKAITRKGFSVPTPIQRKTIPLILDGQDVVGMARTGSGKTAAFVIPMIEKLKSHSAKVGARAMVLSPSRELALQTLKVVKEMGKGTDLRTTLLVGGDSLEDQFGSMASNPDIIIATPGRFEHLKVEMGLELSSVTYVVFDEADRLFEMGFAAQLHEIMYSLPPNRQTLLFSATLPKSLVEFARAGLQDPKLVRLDAESKIAPGLQSAFFTVKRSEKEGALLHILQDVIQMPTGETEAVKKAKEPKKNDKKRKRGPEGPSANETPSQHSTVVFTATKHHVEYLANFLKSFGYAVSYVYGALDQTARKMQVEDFRKGMTNIMVVTDVAARGIDIPVLANVINYDFPSQPKVFVHRVGRTARAGKEGWAYSLITSPDLPYLLDLQLFLSRKLVLGRAENDPSMFKESIVIGAMKRDKLEQYDEEVKKLLHEDDDLKLMQDVAGKGEKQYMRTRNAAAAESVKRAKDLTTSERYAEANMLFDADGHANVEQQRLDMLARVSGFRPKETVFEVGKRGVAQEAAEIQAIKRRRAKIEAKPKNQKDEDSDIEVEVNGAAEQSSYLDDGDDSDEDLILTQPNGVDMDEASDTELRLTFSAPEDPATKYKKKKTTGKDEEFFMGYNPSTINMAEDKAYGVNSGGTNSHFLNDARGATMDLINDESSGFKEATKAKGLRWDKKSKKYVARANDEDGSKGQKMIKGESGQKIAASFKSGRFDAWRKANRVERLPRVGEQERANSHHANSEGGKRFKHKQERAPKEADKFRDDYYKRKKKVDAAREKRVGKFADGKGKSEIRGVEDVRKLRKLQDRRKDKNARPQRKGK